MQNYGCVTNHNLICVLWFNSIRYPYGSVPELFSFDLQHDGMHRMKQNTYSVCVCVCVCVCVRVCVCVWSSTCAPTGMGPAVHLAWDWWTWRGSRRHHLRESGRLNLKTIVSENQVGLF